MSRDPQIDEVQVNVESRGPSPVTSCAAIRAGIGERRTAAAWTFTAALVALKTSAMLRRPHSAHPQKVGSGIHDLVRLVGAAGARRVAQELLGYDSELVGRPAPVHLVSTGMLGDWYANVWFWRPRVAVFVNEGTLLLAHSGLAIAR
jgi:hypothetical protein